MIKSATISFRDVESGDDATLIVRYDAASVALCISLRSGGDIEVRMNKEDTKKVIEALSRAT
jgi:hypothetical protein